MVSVYPCDIHHGRIRGALESIRITLLRGQDRATRKLRVCPFDHQTILEEHADEWVLVADEGLSPQDEVCSACGAASDDGGLLVPAFVYSYARGQEVREYFAQYCTQHAAELAVAYGLVSEARDGARASSVGV